MKLCKICIKSDILCSGCSKKLERGEISKTDITVSRALAKMNLSADYMVTVEDAKTIIIVAGGDIGAIIGRGGKNTKQLSQVLGKEVRIIEKTGEKQMIEKILRSPIIGINILYSNGERYRIRMHKTKQKVSAELLSAVLGRKVEIVFE